MSTYQTSSDDVDANGNTDDKMKEDQKDFGPLITVDLKPVNPQDIVRAYGHKIDKDAAIRAAKAKARARAKEKEQENQHHTQMQFERRSRWCCHC